MTSLSDAATLIQNTEATALTAIKAAVDTFKAALDAAVANLDYPAGYPSASLTVTNTFKSNLQWGQTEMDAKLAAYAPAPVTPVQP